MKCVNGGSARAVVSHNPDIGGPPDRATIEKLVGVGG
jgi:hypothetical protein